LVAGTWLKNSLLATSAVAISAFQTATNPIKTYPFTWRGAGRQLERLFIKCVYTARSMRENP
jgi:hypothetical protein